MAWVRLAGRRGVREEPAFDTPLMRRQLEPGGSGLEAARTCLECDQAGNSRGGWHVLAGRLRGRSAAYPQRCRRGTAGLLLRRANLSEHGNRPDVALCARVQRVMGLGAPTTDRSGRGGAAVVLRAGESPRTWGRAAAVSRREGFCNAGRCVAERRCSWVRACRAVVEGIGNAGQASPLGGGRSRPPVR